MIEGSEAFWDNLIVESPEHEAPIQQIEDTEARGEDEAQDFDDIMVIADEDEARDGRRLETMTRDAESSGTAVERSGQQRSAMAASKKEEKEEKRPKKGARIEAMMEQYLKMRTKQNEAEAAQPASEKEAREKEAREKEAREKVVHQGSDFSIKRCITVLNKMEVSKQEKAKAYSVFIKCEENREAFLSACEIDPETALIWLRNEIA